MKNWKKLLLACITELLFKKTGLNTNEKRHNVRANSDFIHKRVLEGASSALISLRLESDV